jgi:hypothetical protein
MTSCLVKLRVSAVSIYDINKVHIWVLESFNKNLYPWFVVCIESSPTLFDKDSKCSGNMERAYCFIRFVFTNRSQMLLEGILD